MRLYTFTHFMLSPMAKGIQALHSTVELFNKYVPNPSNDDAVSSDTYDMLFDWSLNHKTCISLNAGTSPDLEELATFFSSVYNIYPWATFNEDESLGGLMTSISVVLPEKIYLTAEMFRNKIPFVFHLGRLHTNFPEEVSDENLLLADSFGMFRDFEQDLIIWLNNYRLAS